MKKRIAWYGLPLIVAGLFVLVQASGNGATVIAANGSAGAKAAPMHSPVPGVCLGWFVQQQQGQQAGSPIKPGGQQTGGAGVSIGQADKTPPPNPGSCEERARALTQWGSLKGQISIDQQVIANIYSNFQQNTANAEWWEQFSKDAEPYEINIEKGLKNLGEGLKSFKIPTTGGTVESAGAVPEELIPEATLTELKLGADDLMLWTSNITKLVASHQLNKINQDTVGELKDLQDRENKLKDDVGSLQQANQLLAMSAPCDSTKLVKKEPTQESSSTQQAASKATAPAATATAAKGGSHALLWILGGGAAAGGAAYAAGKLVAGACSNSQAIADLEQEQQLCTANTVACQNAANQSAQAVTSYCSCLGKAPPGASTTIDQELAALQSGAGCQ